MGIYSVAGARAYIGGVLTMGDADMTAADFASQSWLEITGLIAMGSLGGAAEIVSVTPLNSGDPASPARVRKIKNTIDAGTVQMFAAADYESAGQLAVIAALESVDSYAFKIELSDKPAGGVSPSRRYFTALVAGAEDVLDTANDVYRFGMSLAVDSNIVRVTAS